MNRHERAPWLSFSLSVTKVAATVTKFVRYTIQIEFFLRSLLANRVVEIKR